MDRAIPKAGSWHFSFLTPVFSYHKAEQRLILLPRLPPLSATCAAWFAACAQTLQSRLSSPAQRHRFSGRFPSFVHSMEKTITETTGRTFYSIIRPLIFFFPAYSCPLHEFSVPMLYIQWIFLNQWTQSKLMTVCQLSAEWYSACPACFLLG